MITVEFFSQDGRRTGFRVSGHSGYAEAGADIVCAAVTAVVRFAEATLNDILGVGAKTRVDDENAEITLAMPASRHARPGWDLDENPEYIEVMEV